MSEDVYLKTTYNWDEKKKPLISGPYESKTKLEIWIKRAVRENATPILSWEVCNKEGEKI